MTFSNDITNTVLAILLAYMFVQLGKMLGKFILKDTDKVTDTLSAYEELWVREVTRVTKTTPTSKDIGLFRLRLIGWYNNGGLTLVERNMMKTLELLEEDVEAPQEPTRTVNKQKKTSTK